MDPENVLVYEYGHLSRKTDNFSESNFVGRCQFGKLHRGMTNHPFDGGLRHFLVKTWEESEIDNYRRGDHLLRLMKELVLLRHEVLINHPGMVKLHGYFMDGEKLCVSYECNAFDSLFNLIPKDGFTWLQRIKSALGLASVLKFLHGIKNSLYKPFIIHNLDAAHVMVDEDYNPKICDFGLVSGGLVPEKRTYSDHDIIGSPGYIDMSSYNAGYCSTKIDVFAFGVILVSLISKRVYSEEDRVNGVPYVYEWALREADEGGMTNTDFSLVNQSLAAECELFPGDGHKITKLALDCVNGDVSQRPTMNQVYRVLKKLETVKQHAHFFGANKELSSSKNKELSSSKNG